MAHEEGASIRGPGTGYCAVGIRTCAVAGAGARAGSGEGTGTGRPEGLPVRHTKRFLTLERFRRIVQRELAGDRYVMLAANLPMLSVLVLLGFCGLAQGLTVPVAAARRASARRAAAPSRMQDSYDNVPPLDRTMPVPRPSKASSAAPGLSPCTIKVIGVGGGGGNTINRMVQEGPGVERSTFLEYIACNTDIQALSASLADRTIQLGRNQARGLGAGGIPAVGRASAIDAAADIEAIVRDATVEKRRRRHNPRRPGSRLDGGHGRVGLGHACAPVPYSPYSSAEPLWTA